MDPNKKFLYFNPDENDSSGEGSQENTVLLPVSTFAGMETTTTSNLRMYFKESVETDTLDVTLLRTSDGDPRDAMEFIVNQINFSKDSVLKIADDFAGETIHPDVKQITSVEFADHNSIRFQQRVVSNISAAQGAGDAAPIRSSNVGEFNSEIITTMFVDLATASVQSSSFDTDLDAIGISGETTPCYITRIVNSVNGYVYKGEFICLETPAGGDTHVGVYSSDDATIAPGESLSSESELITPAAQAFGNVTEFSLTTGITDDDYLYLAQGNTQAEAQYTAGKFLIRLYGFKVTGL